MLPQLQPTCVKNLRDPNRPVREKATRALGIYCTLDIPSYPGHTLLPWTYPPTPDIPSYPGHTLLPWTYPPTPDIPSYPRIYTNIIIRSITLQKRVGPVGSELRVPATMTSLTPLL